MQVGALADRHVQAESTLHRRSFLSWASASAGAMLLADGLPAPVEAGTETSSSGAGSSRLREPVALVYRTLEGTEAQTLLAVQDVLLPSSPQSPGARDLGAGLFVDRMLAHPDTDPLVLARVRSALATLEKWSQERAGMPFAALDPVSQSVLMRELEEDEAGAEALWDMLRLTLEAALADPVYGGNPDGKGWSWLEVTPGQPRPAVPWLGPEQEKP